MDRYGDDDRAFRVAEPLGHCRTRPRRAPAPARTVRAPFARAANPTRASSVPLPRPWQRSVGRTRRMGPDAPSAQGHRHAVPARLRERGRRAVHAAARHARSYSLRREARRPPRARARRSRLRRRRRSTAEEEAWADEVCASVASWRTEVETIATDAAKAITEPGATRATLESAIDEGLEATETLLEDLRGAVPPDTPEGDEAKAAVDAFLDNVHRRTTRSSSALAGLPEDAGLAEVIAELSGLADEPPDDDRERPDARHRAHGARRRPEGRVRERRLLPGAARAGVTFQIAGVAKLAIRARLKIGCPPRGREGSTPSPGIVGRKSHDFRSGEVVSESASEPRPPCRSRRRQRRQTWPSCRRAPSG